MPRLNEIRVQVSQCESKVNEAHAKLHNAGNLLADATNKLFKCIRKHTDVHGLEAVLCNESNEVLEDLHLLRDMLTEATEALRELY